MLNGTQSISRAITLIRLVAERNETGADLSELISLSELSRSTAHRILQVLVRERFIERHPGTRRYHLGLEFFSLSSLTSNRLSLADIARPIMLKLSDRTGDTVFLSVRAGHHAVCLARIEGNYPIKALTLAVGSRRPLGVGAGSLALLAALPEDVSRDAIAKNQAEIESYPGYDAEMMDRLVRHTRIQGYAFNDGRIVSGMSAVGIAVRSSTGEPLAALSIAAISKRMGKVRRGQLLDLLRTAVIELRNRMARNSGLTPSSIGAI